jgi:hypothetical protein
MTDMGLSKAQYDALFSLNSTKRNGLKNAFNHWPGAVVPFEIDQTFGEDSNRSSLHNLF